MIACLFAGATHKILILGRDSLDELVAPQIQLARLGILDGIAQEVRLGLRRDLGRFLGAHKGLLHRLLDHTYL